MNITFTKRKIIVLKNFTLPSAFLLLFMLIRTSQVQGEIGTWNGPSLNNTWDTTSRNWSGFTSASPWISQGNSADIGTAGNDIEINSNIFVDNISIASSANHLTLDAGRVITQNARGAAFLMYGSNHANSSDGNTFTINGAYYFGITANDSDILRVGGDNSGNASSYNGIIINTGGSLVRLNASSGTHNDVVGQYSGSSYNYINMDGGTFNRNLNQRLYVGALGSYNSMTIRNGGQLTGSYSMSSSWGGYGNRILHIGESGGAPGAPVSGDSSYNHVDINGPGSVARVSQVFTIGNGTTSIGNYMKIENGGGAYVAMINNSSVIGGVTGANGNYIEVTGANSSLNIHNTGNAANMLNIGKLGTIADSNHLDIFSGATANLYCGVMLGGMNSSFNLGDGVGNSTANLGNGAQTYLVNLSDSSAKLNINNGTLVSRINNVDMVTGPGRVVLNGSAKFSIGENLQNTVSSAISGTGDLTKIGGGTLTLSAANTYTGGTTVDQGSLVVNGSVGSVVVNTQGSLGGSGVVGALTLNSGSLLKPGNSPGNLTAESSVWNAGATYQWQIASVSGVAGTDWDLFTASGNLDLSNLSANSQFKLALDSGGLLSGFDSANEYSWTFAKAAGLLGISTVAGTDITSLFAIDLNLFNAGNGPQSGFKVLVGDTTGGFTSLKIAANAVPEPSAFSLLVVGIGGLLMMRSRRS